jgi:DNA mismatch endonuclease (patch repair protein)
MFETREQRSRTMRSVRSRDTKPEMTVRRFLHSFGLRYRLHDSRLPGVPDLVFPSLRTVLFVHGCFWHQHPGCCEATRPQTNTSYWNKKLDSNVMRDARNCALLKAQGWRVLVIWECETRNKSVIENLALQIQFLKKDDKVAVEFPEHLNAHPNKNTYHKLLTRLRSQKVTGKPRDWTRDSLYEKS